ncbi:MAG: S46 family peptidase [Acidobacteria bacterium]|nr:S46 family peptidase [Acidobacteriota bacterium]
MMHRKRARILMTVAVLIAVAGLLTLPASADEGMWTFDNPPVKQLKERYGFNPTQQWLDHVRLSSVRFNDGGSGSFISPGGLVLTNHHVARGQLQKVSTPEHNYVKDGFLAKTPAEELKCPDLELNVLMSMKDVTDRVRGAVKPGMSDKDALEARKAEIAKIEKESLDSTGLRSDVVTLYSGGEYWLYRYKKYTDIRLVFAPEVAAAFFGGDPDNFTYPRYDLDMAIFRVYEDGKPIKSPDFLKVSAKGPAPNDLVFVSGNPGSTDRLYTMARLKAARDVTYKLRLELVHRMLNVFRRYAAGGPEQARQADMMIFGLENAIKAFEGEYKGLKDPQIWKMRQQQEQEFRKRVAANPEWQKKYGDAWTQIEKAQQLLMTRLNQYAYRRMPGFRLPRLAETIYRYVTEVPKPDGKRLDGYHDAQLDSLRFRMFSPAPIYPGLEEALLADQLDLALNKLGPDDPFVKAALDGRSPAQEAKYLISGTKLADPAFRRELVKGGAAAVEASKDPLVAWAVKLEPQLRKMHDWFEDNVESVFTAAGEKIGEARFAVYGKSMYPDATFTLRLSYGSVRGYPMNGTKAPPMTTFYGLFDRAYSFGLKPPFLPPQRDFDKIKDLDLKTPLDFVSTCDIIGGNSGSPVINRDGELVGLIFDGNIESLVSRFAYDDVKSRAVAVDSAAIVEAMTKLYDTQYLLDEMQVTK